MSLIIFEITKRFWKLLPNDGVDKIIYQQCWNVGVPDKLEMLQWASINGKKY